MEKVIIDGDWGGDEMQLAAVLLAHPHKAKILGATCVFGNTGHDQVVHNALDILSFLKGENVPVYPGAKQPTGMPLAEGDNAHGDDGVGGVKLPRAARDAETLPAKDFILDMLICEQPGTVTISATGPLTNIAAAIRDDAETMKRVKHIYVMGGCTTSMNAADMPARQGNITHHAEFNFYMAPQDAQTVMESGLPITLLPMNCTHQLTFTAERQRMLQKSLELRPETARTLGQLMSAPAELDRAKFASAPVMHDIHTALCLLYPQHYDGRRGKVSVLPAGERQGLSFFQQSADGAVAVMEKINDPDALYSVYLKSVQKIYGVGQSPVPKISLAP